MVRIILLITLFTFSAVNSFAESGFFVGKVLQEEKNGKIIEKYSNQKVNIDEERYEDFTKLNGHPINDYAKDAPSIFEPKDPTPSRFFAADLSMPDRFATTNNLARKVGAFYRAFGEIIFVQGSVTDSFGVPISGAIVEIWQTNSAGKYHSLLEPDSEYIDKFFNMSGRTVTDNLGNYHFITIMPGSHPGRAPHINMNIYHQKFGKLQTEMYFEDHPYNKGDYQYLVYTPKERKLVTAKVHHSNILDTKSIKVCTFDITMKGIHKYKKF